MKLSESKVIKTLNLLITAALILYVIILIVQIFSYARHGNRAIQEYSMHNIIAKPDHKIDTTDYLKSWFNDSVIIQNTNRALVYLRFKNYEELLSTSAILFQISIFLYYLMIGVILLCVKLIFKSFCEDKVFTNRNASMLMIASLILMWLPIMKWINQELFINCLTKVNSNVSNYIFTNGENFFGSETIIGLLLMAFGLAFKVGVDIKQENESFV